MKFMELHEFLKMPPGTVYVVARDSAVDYPSGQMMVKGETLSDSDWTEAELLGIGGANEDDQSQLIEMMRDKEDVSVQGPVFGRFGEFPKDGQIQFWVLSGEDMLLLSKLLYKWVVGGKP